MSPNDGGLIDASWDGGGNESDIDALDKFFLILVLDRDLKSCVKEVVRLNKF